MANPILITLSRGNITESLHRGAFAIVESSGNVVAALGDTSGPVFPRSAIKALQALPLVETGAADVSGFSDAELALACASHSGEPVHAETAETMLQKIGLETDALACGPQWPLEDRVALELARTGDDPTPLHNNCSGKHAGMLALAKHLKVDPHGYEEPDHPVQRYVRSAIEEMTGETLSSDLCGIDGCSVPTWAASLQGFARAFARLADPDALNGTRREAADRIVAACVNEPHMVEGEQRFGTGVMRKVGRTAFVKGGAEGVYCAAFPDLKLGLALKIDDGAKRGSEAAAAYLIATLLPDQIRDAGDLHDMQLRNWRGLHVGDIAPSDELKKILDDLRERLAAN